MFKVICSIVLLVMVTACSGDKSVKVASLQKNDKSLSCKEVQLEINEASFYRKTAEKNKNPKIKNLLMPIGYISTYVSAEDAIDAASSRIDYLNRIYDILKCDDPVMAQASNTRFASPVRYSPPQQQQYGRQYSEYPVQRNSGYW